MQAFFGSFELLHQNVKKKLFTKIQRIQWSKLLFDESKDEGASEL